MDSSSSSSSSRISRNNDEINNDETNQAQPYMFSFPTGLPTPSTDGKSHPQPGSGLGAQVCTLVPRGRTQELFPQVSVSGFLILLYILLS